jgi:hypothetical protein
MAMPLACETVKGGRMAGGENAPSGPDYDTAKFAGDLFLELAADGRLVLDADRADGVIAGLEETLAVVRIRLRILEVRSQLPALGAGCHPADQPVVDAAFAEQIAPGQLRQALHELPKYIEAFRVARRSLPHSP